MSLENNHSIPKENKISIIIPVMNEEKNIFDIVKRIDASLSLKKIIYEIIFIDDHSTDISGTIIKNLSRRYPIRLFSKIGKKGKAHSLLEGFSYAQYEHIAMIDADLQYPPEAIPEMLKKINEGADIVVANRRFSKTFLLRKIISKSFLWFFGKGLHGFNCDVQSGLKLFKKKIIERITLQPGPWSFDLEFLVQARAAGYKINSLDIAFSERKNENPKISLIPASFEIGLSAIKLKLRSAKIIPFHQSIEKIKGKGFHFKGIEFVHHSNLRHHETAFHTFYRRQKLIVVLVILLVIVGFLLNWYLTALSLMALITVIYFLDLLFNLFLIVRGFVKRPEIIINNQELKNLSHDKLPTYTILCPLYREWEVLPQFVRSISSLDYPKNKLQVLLLLEEDDKETLKHAQNYPLPNYFELVIVPHSFPKTKPKALNYGLKKATGEFSVIYDAEDMPEPKQLKKALIGFKKSDPSTICIQAKLNFYNPKQNFLTRVFTAEYSLWFDLILTGLQSITAPIPLGGTSNHFRTVTLHNLKGWDSFNVTEDCDLGMRLAKKGYRTALINSITLEEANSDIKNWLNQRTRWIKGYIQTYLVHMRNPKGLTYPFQLIVGGKVLSMFINPFMWVTTILYFALRSSFGVFISQFFPGPILYLGVFSLVFGNFLYMYYYMIGCAKRGYYDLIKYVFLVPFYWLGMSLAAWLAVGQLIRRPHFWPKTIHGFHIDREKALMQGYDNLAYIRVVNQLEESMVITRQNFVQNIIDSVKFRFLSATKRLNINKTWNIKTLSSGSFLIFSMMTANFLNFLFNAYLGRKISFEDFGLITLINTLWFLVSVFIDSLGSTVNHRVAYLTSKEGKHEAANFFFYVLAKIIKAIIIFSLIWLLLSPVLTRFFKLDNVIPLLTFLPIIFFGIVGSISQGFLQGNFYFFSVGLIIIAVALTKLLTAVGFVSVNLNPLTYLAIPISVMVGFAATMILILQKIKSAKFDDRHHFVFPKKFYLAAVISSLSTSAFLTLDILLAKHFLSPRLAGEYALLSLVGKMIYFFGSSLKVFMIPFVSRDLGASRDPAKSFYRLLIGTLILTSAVYLLIGIFGVRLIPFLFGPKAYSITLYLPIYSLAIAVYVINYTIISYHLVRHHYSFPVTALFLSGLMALGIMINHQNIGQITNVILITSLISLSVMIFMHLIQREGRFLIRSVVDLIGLFLPLPKIDYTAPGGKRILIFNWRDTKHTFAGGAEVYIHELAKRWVKRGHRVTLFCGNDGHCARSEVIDGVWIVRRGGFYFVYFWAILYYLLRFRGKYDMIIDSENGIPFFTPLFTGEKKFLLIHHVHQEVFRRTLKPPLSWLASFLEIKLMPFVYKNIQIITVSPSSKKDIMDKQLSTQEPLIIYNGVDLSKFIPGQKSKNPLVLYLGRLKFYKSLNVFIRTADEVLKKIPNVEFVIAGDGEEKNRLMCLTNKLGLGEKIKFLGRVTEEQKIKLFQQAWVFVNPSFMEGWGITTIEANACGTPVIASDVLGLRDSVHNPRNGILVSHGDVDGFTKNIIQMLNDKLLRKKMSRNSVVWAKKFDWEKSAVKSLKLFQREK